MYQVLARKWRPQTFEELVGQEPVARTLSNAISADRLAHAYIFAGLRGTGKTTVARILAKCLNCEKGPTTEPCGVCDPCKEIAGSRAMDVMEIDAASRTKVEQTRELLEVVSYAPVRDRYKILIIDEAHMLSKASFNALLKTLEEPPPNVLFILATTELHKVLPTIASRCQVFDFRRVSTDEVTGLLRRICDENGVRVSDVALERVARAGEGSVRDSLSLLERVLAFSGEEVADDDVLRMLGAVRSQVLIELTSALASRDAAGMLNVLDGLLDEGHDPIHFWSELLAALRDLLLLETLPEREDLLARPAEEARALHEAAAGLSREDLTRAFHVVAELEPGLKNSAQPRFLFEAALIRLASLGAVRPIEDVLKQMAGEPVPAAKPRPERRAIDDPGRAQRRAAPQKKKGAEALKPTPTAAVEPDPAPRDPVTPRPPARRQGGDAGQLVEAVRDARPMLAAMLSEASIRLEQGFLNVQLPAEMAPMKGQLEAKDSLALLGRIAEQFAGAPAEVRILVEGADEARGPAPPPAGRSRTPRPASPRPRPRTGGGDAELLQAARKEPGVRKLLDTFGAQVLEIRALDGMDSDDVAKDPVSEPEDPSTDGPQTNPSSEES